MTEKNIQRVQEETAKVHVPQKNVPEDPTCWLSIASVSSPDKEFTEISISASLCNQS